MRTLVFSLRASFRLEEYQTMEHIRYWVRLLVQGLEQNPTGECGAPPLDQGWGRYAREETKEPTYSSTKYYGACSWAEFAR